MSSKFAKFLRCSTRRRSSAASIAAHLTILFAATVWVAENRAVADQAYHVGLDFIDTTTTAFLSDFVPFPLTTPGNFFVSQGGLEGWTEDQARRAVALAVDDTFRDLDVGDPDRTVRVAVYLGPAPTHVDGQRLNVLLGGTAGSPGLLGLSNGDSFDDPQVTDTFVAGTLLDAVDNLGSSFLTYDTADGVINSIAGVVAHEIGHVFDAPHVTVLPSDPDPLPLVASEQTGLPTEARLTERRFSTTKPGGASNAETIIGNAGTTLRGDFNLDAAVDISDVFLLFTNWGMTDRLYHEGDANGDHIVDIADYNIFIDNFTAGPGSANLAAAIADAYLSSAIFGNNGLGQAFMSTPAQVVPEPSSFSLIAPGIACLFKLLRQNSILASRPHSHYLAENPVLSKPNHSN